MLKIRRSSDRLILNTGIPYLGKTVFILRRGPEYFSHNIVTTIFPKSSELLSEVRHTTETKKASKLPVLCEAVHLGQLYGKRLHVTMTHCVVCLSAGDGTGQSSFRQNIVDIRDRYYRD